MPKPRKMPGFGDPAKYLEQFEREYGEGKGQDAYPSVAVTGMGTEDGPEDPSSGSAVAAETDSPARASRKGGTKPRRRTQDRTARLIGVRVTTTTKVMLELYRSFCRTERDDTVRFYDVLEDAVRMYVLKKAPALRQTVEMLEKEMNED